MNVLNSPVIFEFSLFVLVAVYTHATTHKQTARKSSKINELLLFLFLFGDALIIHCLSFLFVCACVCVCMCSGESAYLKSASCGWHIKSPSLSSSSSSPSFFSFLSDSEKVQSNEKVQSVRFNTSSIQLEFNVIRLGTDTYVRIYSV